MLYVVELTLGCRVAELLAGLPEEEDADPPQEEAPVDARLLQVEEGDEHDRCKKERRKLLLARSYVDLREFRRAAHALEGCKGSHALFVRKYSLYMAGENRKEEERQELKGQCPVVNVELKSLEKELAAAYNTQSLDSFGMFLYGLVLTERAVPDSARAVLVAACNAYPWNWAAWSALTQVCLEPEHLHRLAVTLKPHYMRDIFVAQALSELSAHEQSLQLYTALQETFPRSRYIKAQSATANYSKRGTLALRCSPLTLFQLLRSYLVPCSVSHCLNRPRSFLSLTHSSYCLCLPLPLMPWIFSRSYLCLSQGSPLVPFSLPFFPLRSRLCLDSSFLSSLFLLPKCGTIVGYPVLRAKTDSMQSLMLQRSSWKRCVLRIPTALKASTS